MDLLFCPEYNLASLKQTCNSPAKGSPSGKECPNMNSEQGTLNPELGTKKAAFQRLFWCPGQESNLHDQKRSPGPQPGASTNSATWAYIKF